MQTPDVNVLVAAYREDHIHHAQARAWLDQSLLQLQRGRRLLLLPMVCASFLRLVTHPRVFAVPATVDEATGFLDALLGHPGIDLGELGAEWPAFVRLCSNLGLTGNAVPDAWIAAAARHAGATVVTLDRDFKKLLAPYELHLLGVH